MTKTIFGERPKGQGVSPAQWKKWHNQFEKMEMPYSLPKGPETREIFLAGNWLDFQLQKHGASDDEIRHECGNLGSSAMTAVLTQSEKTPKWDESIQLMPNDIWKLAQDVVTKYVSRCDEKGA